MKKLLCIIVILLTGCSTLNVTAPDGTTLKYSSFMGTTDTLKGTMGAANIEFKGKQNIDPATVQSILGGMGK